MAWFQTVLGEQGSLTLLKDHSLIDLMFKNNVDVIVKPLKQPSFLRSYFFPIILPMMLFRYITSNFRI